jgi:hypothetical protein
MIYDKLLEADVTGVSNTLAEVTIDTEHYNPGGASSRVVAEFVPSEDVAGADLTLKISSSHDNSTFVDHVLYTVTNTAVTGGEDILAGGKCDYKGGFTLPLGARRYVKFGLTSGTGDATVGKVFKARLKVVEV